MSQFDLAQAGEAKRQAEVDLNAALAALAEAETKGLSTADAVGKIRASNDAATKAGKAYDAAEEIHLIRQRNEAALATGSASKGLLTQPLVGGITGSGGAVRSIKTLMEEGGFGKRKTASFTLTPAETKTLLTLSDINIEPTRQPRIREYAAETRTVADMILSGTTDNNTITYMEETTFTNAAAMTAEGAVKQESALDYTKRTVPVEKVATWLPVTSEALDDVPGLQSTIENRLRFMIARTEESQILVGNGTPPQLRGLNNASGVQTQAKGADPTPDAIYKAMNLIRNTGFAEPTGVVLHPNDWEPIRLLRTIDGIYIWGNPSEAGPERIWGLDVRQTTAQTENTGLVVSREYAELIRREGVTVTASSEHSDYFIYNKVAILAEERIALAIYRGAAFCKVTGI